MDQKLEVLKDNEDWIAIAKPAGWLSIPGRGKKENVPVVSEILGKQLREGRARTDSPDLFIVHRLDEGTSGAMIFAKNSEAHRFLNGLFENGKIKKTYWCVVKGIPSIQTINAPLFKLPSKKVKSVVDPKGKASVTEIRVIQSAEGFSVVEAKPLTGRSHQIRVHLSHVGSPLVGDPLYGGVAEAFGNSWSYPLLHCRDLEFQDRDGKLVKIHCPVSDYILQALEALEFIDGCRA